MGSGKGYFISIGIGLGENFSTGQEWVKPVCLEGRRTRKDSVLKEDGQGKFAS